MAIITKKKHYITKEPHYILNGKKVVKTYDLYEWAEWFETAGKKRIVKQDRLKNGLFISTVFLGIDHNFHMSEKPAIFETMVFDENIKHQWEFPEGTIRSSMGEDIYQVRYSTYEEAENGHREAVNKFKGRKPSPRVLHPVKRIGDGIFNGISGKVGKGRPENTTPDEQEPKK